MELAAGVSRSDPASYSSVAEALDAVAVDVLVDYTHSAIVRENVLAALERRVNVVVGSSGLQAVDYDEIDALARKQQVGVVAAGNFSLTAALLLRCAVEVARHLEAWEVIDYASAGKPDAPSGTAREVAERLDEVRPPTVGVPVDETLGAREARGPPSPAPRCTRFAFPASSSRRKSSSRRRASGWRSATTPVRLRRRTSQGPARGPCRPGPGRPDSWARQAARLAARSGGRLRYRSDTSRGSQEGGPTWSSTRPTSGSRPAA